MVGWIWPSSCSLGSPDLYDEKGIFFIQFCNTDTLKILKCLFNTIIYYIYQLPNNVVQHMKVKMWTCPQTYVCHHGGIQKAWAYRLAHRLMYATMEAYRYMHCFNLGIRNESALPRMAGAPQLV
jgi:hypothetical protein